MDAIIAALTWGGHRTFFISHRNETLFYLHHRVGYRYASRGSGSTLRGRRLMTLIFNL